MKAIVITCHGEPAEVLELQTLPDPPAPGAGEALVDILASPINPSDLLNVQGRFRARPAPVPAIGGAEGVGEVVAVGAGVHNVAVGDRVLALFGGRGNWCERVKVPATELFPLDARADVLQLAMLAANPATAWHMLHRFVRLEPGDWVLQNAGNSAVGQCVIRIARALGFRTLSLVRRPEQTAGLYEIGADQVLVDRPGRAIFEEDAHDLSTRVDAAVDGAAIRLAFDAVAGDATARLARCLADSGTVVNYGLLSNSQCHIAAPDLIFRHIALQGFWFTGWFESSTADERSAVYSQLVPLLNDGTLRVAVEATYALEQFSDAIAHAAAESRQGKVLLVPNPGRLPTSRIA